MLRFDSLNIKNCISFSPSAVSVLLHPSTGDEEHKRFVCLTLLIHLPPEVLAFILNFCGCTAVLKTCPLIQWVHDAARLKVILTHFWFGCVFNKLHGPLGGGLYYTLSVARSDKYCYAPLDELVIQCKVKITLLPSPPVLD